MIKKVFLSCVTTGSTINAEIMNMAIVSAEKSIYIERADSNLINILTNDELIYAHSKSKFPDSISEKVFIKSENLVMLKNHDIQIFKELERYLLELSEGGKHKLQFVVDSPVDWVFFISIAFPHMNNIPIIPEYVLKYPIDLMSMYQYNNLKIQLYEMLRDTEYASGNILEGILDRPIECEYSSLLSAKYNSELTKFLAW